MDRRDYLKPSRFGNIERRRQMDTKTLKNERSARRTTTFNLRRDFGNVEEVDVDKNVIENVPPQKVIDRKLALQRFKAQKEVQKQALKGKKKPPFVVGIPHHGSSPLLKDINRTVKGRKSPAKEFTFQPHKVLASVKKLTSPHTPTVLKRSQSVKKEPFKNMTNSEMKLRISPKLSCSLGAEEVLAAPLPKSEGVDGCGHHGEPIPEEQFLPKLEPETHPATEVNDSTQEINVLSNRVSEARNVVQVEGYAVNETACNEESSEHSNQVAFQLTRLKTETASLLTLADQWETIALCETLPQEVADEVDSVVGQTRLLTSDKFKQFHGLIVQFQNKTGTHPVTLDDLNGFWDMIYLQVESMNKRYMELENLKKNNWLKLEPPMKKKKRPVKKSKPSKTTPGAEKSTIYNDSMQNNSLQAPEDEPSMTPVTEEKLLMPSARLHLRRTRSNSPSPFIAIRLSGIGRSIGKTPNMKDNTPGLDGTSSSTLIHSVEAEATPKSAIRKSIKTEPSECAAFTTASFTEPVERIAPDTANFICPEESLLPPLTPRRSARLMKINVTPVTQVSRKCISCDSVSCDSPDCLKESISRSISKRPRSSKKHESSSGKELLKTGTICSAVSDVMKESASKNTRLSKKLRFSPKENVREHDSTSVSELTTSLSEEKSISKSSTSGSRFSLRPSILIVHEDMTTKTIPKNSKKKRNTSVLTTVNENNYSEDNILGEAQNRRSNRQSRKVTFESEEKEEQPSFKLPATPYRKSRAGHY